MFQLNYFVNGNLVWNDNTRNSKYYGSMKWKYQLHIVHWIIVNYYGIYFIQFFGVFQAIIGKYLEWISNFYTVVAIQGICRSVL